MELINFQCGKCKEYWNIIKGRMINDKRCMKCNCRICEKCYDDVEMCLSCEIDYLKNGMRNRLESYNYLKLMLSKLMDKHSCDSDGDDLKGATRYDSDEEYNNISPPSEED